MRLLLLCLALSLGACVESHAPEPDPGRFPSPSSSSAPSPELATRGAPLWGNLDFAIDCSVCDEAYDTCFTKCACSDPTATSCAGTKASCITTCKEELETCWQKFECDRLDPDCANCFGCSTECDPNDADCLAACEAEESWCWQVNDCDGPYVESTPICYYLDRGTRDFRAHTRGSYTVSMPGVGVLDDIERLEFGLDLPATRCVQNPHGIPCADRDLSTSWLIDELAMQVNGVTLFSAKKERNATSLLKIDGGSQDEGIRGFSSLELRSNPSWGLSGSELATFLPQIPLPTDAASVSPESLLAVIGAPRLERRQVEQLIEGALGRALAGQVKAGAVDVDGCAGSIYCDNKFGILYGFRGTWGAGQPDCDLGGCLAVASGAPSPWVEVIKIHGGEVAWDGHVETSPDQLNVDLDLEAALAVWDITDCPHGAPACLEPATGLSPVWLADIGIRVTLEPTCTNQPGGDGKKVVGFKASGFSMRTEAGGLLANLASGLYGGVCGAIGGLRTWILGEAGEKYDDCSLDAFIEGKVHAAIMGKLSTFEILKDLDTCPEPGLVILDDGGLLLDLGADPQPDLATMDPSQFASWARLRNGPSVEARPILEAFHGQDVSKISVVNLLDNQTIAALAGPAVDTKVRFEHLDELVGPLCAMFAPMPAPMGGTMQLCNPAMPLAQVLLPPPRVDASLAFSCKGGQPPGDPENDRACEALARIKSFVSQPAVMNFCFAPNVPPLVDLDDILPTLWGQFEAAAQGCLEAANFRLESLLPAPSVELLITTGRTGASDTFPFVRFGDREGLSRAEYEDFKCKNRSSYDLIEDLPDYASCPDPTDPANFGLAGCPCADLDVFQPEDLALDSGRPDGAGSYALNGLTGKGQYCEDDEEGQVVCGRMTLQGRDFPICQRCDVDTKLGCACQDSEECQGLEDGLVCIGGAEEGWPTGTGTCLPDPGLASGREALEEMRWFCLDNCDAIDGHGGSVGVCYFNQLSAKVDHGTCVALTNQCDGAPFGACEEQGMMCKDGGGGPDVCEAECQLDADCWAAGFPGHWVCDAASHSPGHCVPPECAAGDAWSFCSLYR